MVEELRPRNVALVSAVVSLPEQSEGHLDGVPNVPDGVKDVRMTSRESPDIM